MIDFHIKKREPLDPIRSASAALIAAIDEGITTRPAAEFAIEMAKVAGYTSFITDEMLREVAKESPHFVGKSLKDFIKRVSINEASGPTLQLGMNWRQCLTQGAAQLTQIRTTTGPEWICNARGSCPNPCTLDDIDGKPGPARRAKATLGRMGM